MIPHVNEKWQKTVLLLVQRVQEFGSLQFFSILFGGLCLCCRYIPVTGRRCKGGKRVPRLRSGLSVSLFLSLSIHVLRDVGTKKRGWNREGWKIKEEKKEEDIKVSFPFLARMIIQLAWITTRGKKKSTNKNFPFRIYNCASFDSPLFTETIIAQVFIHFFFRIDL